MKTTDEFAKESNPLSVGKSIVNTLSYNKGFKAGIELAQRWIPISSGELPEEEYGFYKPVLVLFEEYGLCSSAAYKNGRFIPDNPVISADEITHWRPIELK